MVCKKNCMVSCKELKLTGLPLTWKSGGGMFDGRLREIHEKLSKLGKS